MGNPYAQVGLTYVRRPLSSGITCALSISILFMCIMSVCLSQEGAERRSWFTDLMPFLILFSPLASHIKEQFACPQARLLPRFRRAHMTIAILAVLIVMGLGPMTLTWCWGMRSVGFTAVVVFLFGATSFLTVVQTAWAGFVMVATMLVSMSEAGQAFLTQIASGQFEGQALGILMVGLAILGLAGRRLLQRNEDTPEFCGHANRCRAVDGGTAGHGEGRLLPELSDWMAERQIIWLTRHARRASTSPISRIVRWQVGMPTGWSLAFWILGPIVLVSVLSLWSLSDAPGTRHLHVFWAYAVMTMGPLVVVVITATKRGCMSGIELLRPVDRRSYFRQLGAAVAWNQFQFWAGLGAAVLLWWGLFHPQLLQFPIMASVLVFSAAFQIEAFAVAVWLARYRSASRAALIMIALFVSALILPSMVFVSSAGRVSAGTLVTVAAIAVVVGPMIVWDAYRRWLVTDLD